MTPQHQAFLDALAAHLPRERLVTDPMRTLALGTDASFYRLVPQVVVLARSEAEVATVLALAHTHQVAVTLRAAGTSLSGQAVSDSVLVLVNEGWTGIEVLDDGARVRLQPGVIGQHANDALRPYGRKIGPDPASINTARIGGMAANNSSGMCCGTAQNGYHTLAAIRVMLADGTVLDTGRTESVMAFRASHTELLDGLRSLARQVQANPALHRKIQHKYRLKNTTGYGLNALIDFDDPVDILAHLMIGSEGTLGFIAGITYDTVPDHAHKASVLVRFATLDACCRAVTALKDQGRVAAVELVDRRSILAVQGKPGMPDFMYGELPADAAALLIEVQGADASTLRGQIDAVETLLQGCGFDAISAFATDPKVCETYWALRKGLFPAVGAVRPVGSTCVIEDVAFPVERLAEGVRGLTGLFEKHGYNEALVFGHALEGNLHFVFAPTFESPSEVRRYSDFMDEVSRLVAVDFGGSLKAEHGTGRNVAPYVELEWGEDGYALMKAIKRLFDPAGLLNPDVIISADHGIHLANLKLLPAADPIVDTCIECGFCEPACPSNGLSLTPRQRIVLWRRIQQLRRDGSDAALLAQLESEYGYAGVDTCAATGMCATRCPVGINTGKLMKQLKGPSEHAGTASAIERHLGVAVMGARAGLGALKLAKAMVGEGGARSLNTLAHKVIPVLPIAPAATPQAAPALPAAPVPTTPLAPKDQVVYFASCVNRTFAEGDTGSGSLAAHTFSLLAKAGITPVYPPQQASLCCGQPFDSLNASEASHSALARTNEALLQASQQGAIDVYLDNAPCSLRLIEAQREGLIDARLKLFDATRFLAERVLPRLTVRKQVEHLAVHVPCATSKAGQREPLLAIARQCAQTLTVPDIACCGFAGSKGFTLPELNANSLRHLREALPEACTQGVSTSRTCQIGLSTHSGRPYASLEALLDDCSSPA
ncbi:FAD-binding and (Fe-S)-binding domain-containing protein [Aquabacterium sp.]|uniref:FAD-binding and (Fe-S)-binding domain-containing protein n=1 Tax=Aquabacterium sp. TaxID=1872578 RepID=UPI0025BFB490|nr:FAD-binding and (Fe-S)-binding domain-containing protein [Aquabacterium sp.]